MSTSSVELLQETLDRIESAANELRTRLRITGDQIIIFGGLSDISEDLGLVKAGEFRSGMGVPNKDSGFSGVRIGSPGWTYNSHRYAIVGLNADVLTFGLSAEDGNFFAYSGDIAGWSITTTEIKKTGLILDSSADSIYIGAAAPRIVLDGTNKQIRSSTYTPDEDGFQIDATTGSAEFNNIIARGEIRSSIFTYGEVIAVGGEQGIFKSSGKLRNDTMTMQMPTPTVLDMEDPPIGHIQYFQVNDLVLIRSGGAQIWLQVNSVTDNTTYFTYSCSLVGGQSGITFTSGTSVVNYGTNAGTDGYIKLKADSNDGPKISLYTFTGNINNPGTEQVRIGNMYDAYGAGANTRFGIGIGDYASGNYLSFNAAVANTFMISNADGGVRISANGFEIIGNGATDVTKRYKTYYSSAGTDYLMGAMFSDWGSPGASMATYLTSYATSGAPWSIPKTVLQAYDVVNGYDVRVTLEGSAASAISLTGAKELYSQCDLVAVYPTDLTGLSNEDSAAGFKLFDFARTFLAGARTELYGAVILNPTFLAGSASNVTRTATLHIDSKPTLTNFTAARNYALDVVDGIWIQSGGLDLHNGSGAGDGSMSYSGNLLAFRNSTNYTGYIFVPLTSPLTSTSWDGDSYSTNTATVIDLSAVFGAPAGIRAALVKAEINDSAAFGTGSLYFGLGPSATSWDAVVLQSHGGDLRYGITAVVPCDANGDVYYKVNASGASTMDVRLTIWGYFI